MSPENFYSKCTKQTNGCWTWNQSLNNSGYGSTIYNGKQQMVHRISWQIYNQKEIPKGMIIMHSCDNRSCINPDHLSLGTQKDNIKDMFSKGRQTDNVKAISLLKTEVGEKNRFAKLTNEIVLEIRKLYSNGVSQSDIAIKFNITNKLVWTIVHRISWKHI